MKLRDSRFLFALIVILAAASQSAIAQTRVVRADRYPGADLGAKINAADRDLGAAAGEIQASGGGRISTQIVVSGNHTLRLAAGTYISATSTPPILLKSGAKLIGASWDTIIVEPTAPKQFTVISAFNHTQRNGAADADISVKDIQIKGANPGFDSVQQAISLGNCSRCTVDHVWINATRSIGIQLGGASFDGHWAEDSKVINCQFMHVASQNLALVNGRNILFENNRFITSGQLGGPGSSNIDVEPNSATDYAENVRILNNLIDMREAKVPTSGNGILVQSGSGTAHVGPILIEGNTIFGGRNTGVVTNVLSNGIYAFGPTMKDVTIRNNRVTRTGQSGLRIEGTRFVVTNNHFIDVGGGGIPGFYVAVSNSQIVGNSFTYSGNGPADGSVQMVGGGRGNTIRDNPGIGFPAR
jgi:parallel beta helix pectate lyase-like protein